MSNPLHFSQYQGDRVPPDYFCPPKDQKGNTVDWVVAFVPGFNGATVEQSEQVVYKRLPNNVGWVCWRRFGVGRPQFRPPKD